MRGWVASIGAWLVACGQVEAPSPPVAPAVPVAQAPVATPPEPHRERRVVVRFQDRELRECTEFVVEGDPAHAETLRGIADGFTSDLDEGSSRVDQGCDEAFGDRVAWGTCAMRIEEPDSPAVVLGTANFYSFAEVYDTDVRMQECLEMSGRWSAQPRDTPEWARARRQTDLAALQRRADEASVRADEAIRTLSGRRR
jgi:hypothetical protein